MRGVVAVMLITVAGLCGCRQIFGLSDLPADAATIDTPDAGPCPALGLSCGGPDTLLSCTTIGQQPTSTTCDWGCTATGTAHCGALAPSGGGVTAMDVTTTTGLASTTLTAITVIDDTGGISGLRSPGTGTIVGIGFHVANGIAIYTFQDLTITNVVQFAGTHPIALVSTSTLTIGPGVYMDLTGDCNNNGAVAIAGGSNGGDHNADGNGLGGGKGANAQGGGGGGGFGALGGLGGKDLNNMFAAAGAVFGTPELATLVGGSGGGGGAGGGGGNGGAGGGAVQLVANGTLAVAGKVIAGGCGGHHGATGGNGGGGGGAGGAILIEAHDVAFVDSAFLSVAGGGGGAPNGGASGDDGHADQTLASGGGNGGAGGGVPKLAGTDANDAGGGGGAVGRIRIHTKSGMAPTLADTMSSPTQSESPTTTTIGAAATQ